MRHIKTIVAIFLCVGVARADCTDQVDKPQKPRDVAQLKWTAAGRTWQVALSWHTKSVAENGEEEAIAILYVEDNLKRPIIGDERNYDLVPNRCDKRIDPSLSAVRLMGRDFLLVTLPDSQRQNGGSGIVAAYLYSIDAKGKLTEVFESAYRGHYMRTPQCHPLVRSYIRPENADGSRFAWVYEYPDVEWVKKKSECAKAPIERVAMTYGWKNGCFAVEEQENRNHERLNTDWDKNDCVTGIGRVDKAAARDGGAGKAAEPRKP